MTVRQYIKRDDSSQDVSEALELITDICDCLCSKRRMERREFSLDTPYVTIRVLAVQ